MRTEVTFNKSPSPKMNYITWAPVGAQIRLVETEAAISAVTVRLRNRDKLLGGQVVFQTAIDATSVDELALDLPVDGTPVDVFVAGLFGHPSIMDGDASIEVIDANTSEMLSSTLLTVRIRRNADDLTIPERDRFLSALATLNDRGMGRFSDFRNIHTNAGSPEAHGNAGFLPWHRAFVLDLERELQTIDPRVTLPYWRFDRPAPKVFSRAFMGVPNQATGTLEFAADNPLQFWATDGVPGIVRRPLFNTQTEAASVISEADTLALGDPGALYELFLAMEGDPHGFAHTSFSGFMSSIPTAARDPLFFLLHANVDRLWAKWQWFKRRFDTMSIETYSFQGSAGTPGATNIGHNLNDTMWPWNQITGTPRPPTAPGGHFPPSSLTNAPGLTPSVAAMIDFQGTRTPASRLGFDYDDVPFEVQ